MTTRLHTALRRRLERLHAGRDDESERGFVLVYVLVVTTLVTMLVATVTLTAAANVVPAQQSAYDEAATAAADGGIQAYYAALLAHPTCSSLTSLGANTAGCAGFGPSSTSGRVQITSASSVAMTAHNQSYYTWKVVAVGANFARVQSTGEVGTASSGLYAKKTVTADITGGLTRNFLDYAYYSTYETLASAYIQKEFAAGRKITFDNSGVLTDAGLSGSPSSVTWSGPPTSGSTGSQWCDALYYTPATGGSTVNPSTSGVGRYFQGSGLPAGYDWQESVSAAAGASSLVGTTHNGICQVDFTSGTTITGPVYSRDSYLLSYGYNNGTTHGAGPEFDAPAYSAWSTSDSPAANPPFRTFPVVGGDTKNGANEPTSAGFTLSLPTSVTGALTSNTATQVCTYTGPTRVWVNAGTATITSPLTAAGTSVCNKNMSGNIAASTSVTSAQVPVANTLIYVKNIGTSSLWSTASADSLFNLSSPSSDTTAPGTVTGTATDAAYTPATGQNPSTKSDGAFTPQWTSYSTGSTCNTSTVLTDLKFFNCYVPKVAHTPAFTDSYSSLKYSIQAALTANPSAYTTASAFQSLVQGLLNGGNSSDAGSANPSNYTNASHRWQVSVTSDAATTDGCTPGSPSSSSGPNPVTGPSSDPLYQQVGASGTTTITTTTPTTCFTATITLQVGTCNVALVLGVCVNLGSYVWGNGTALLGGGSSITQFKVTDTIKQPSVRTQVTATTVGFPNSSDITQYPSWDTSKADAPGDAYVEGTVTGKLSVVSENDIIDTGNLTYTTAGTDAADLVAANNVRVYHPVKCADSASTTTTAGYCPNDTTGLSPKGTLQFTSSNFSSHPSRQYVNLRSDLATLKINAAIYALTGEFIVDNYDRGDGYNPTSGGGRVLAGDGLDTLTVTGGVYQVHHGAAGVSWEISSSSTARPTSGYTEAITWDSTLKNRSLPFAPSPSGTNSTSNWQIVGISSGSGS